MSIQYISGGLLALFLLMCIPNSAEAYFTTAQSGVKLSGSAALYTISYAFGLEDHDIYMPVLAVRNLSEENSRNKVGYTIREESETVTTDGTATGIVLSDAPIENGMYRLQKGASHTMTLLVVYTTPADTFEEDYALQVDWLPYAVEKDGSERLALQLNPSELQYYITQEVELNTGNYPE